MRGSLFDLQSAVSGASASANTDFDGVSTDSRKVGSGQLFVALRGEHFDAHDFLAEVVARGVAAVVVEKLPEGLTIPALLVPDTRVALGQIAAHWRRQFTFPVIGVTGSNGKTTVKEMIASILAATYGDAHHLATRGNLNNDIGVPLTVFRLDAACRAAVIEMGMNHPGEIAVLSAIAQPTVALVNNAQREHLEFMANVEAVARENGAVIRGLGADGVAVFPADDAFAAMWRADAASSGQRKVLSFGLSADADVRCTYQPSDFGSVLQVSALGQEFAVRLAAAGEHNVRNALAAIACTLAIGIEVAHVVRGLEAFAPVSGRLQRKTAAGGVLVIDDTYNANPDSVRAAIDVLAQAAAPRILVLGDMGEVGDQGPQFHQEIGTYARARGIDRFFATGELTRHAVEAFGANAMHCTGMADLQNAVQAQLTPGTTVLVKGSRFMKMERAVQHLLGQQIQETH